MLMSRTTATVLMALASWSTVVSAQCDAVDTFLSIPNPMVGDMTIDITVDTIQCPDPTGDDGEIEEIIVDGGTLTLSSDATVRFINLGFTVMPGAAVVFDMPKTRFGPNPESPQDFPSAIVFDVREGASVVFNGKFVAKDVRNNGAFFRSAGYVEMKKIAIFERCGSVFVDHSGIAEFHAATRFVDNEGIAVNNIESGSVRFYRTSLFDDNGNILEGFSGVSVQNFDAEGTVVFDGDAVFRNHSGKEGVTVFNYGTMTFNGKASFDDNTTNFNGGAVRNQLGSMTFNRAVQFNNNQADEFGGGLAVEGGDVTFKKAVKFDGNEATSGAAFTVLFGELIRGGDVIASGFGSLTFEKPSVVRIGTNTAAPLGDDNDCTVGEVEEGATVVGFPNDDICVSATS